MTFKLPTSVHDTLNRRALRGPAAWPPSTEPRAAPPGTPCACAVSGRASKPATASTAPMLFRSCAYSASNHRNHFGTDVVPKRWSQGCDESQRLFRTNILRAHSKAHVEVTIPTPTSNNSRNSPPFLLRSACPRIFGLIVRATCPVGVNHSGAADFNRHPRRKLLDSPVISELSIRCAVRHGPVDHRRNSF